MFIGNLFTQVPQVYPGDRLDLSTWFLTRRDNALSSETFGGALGVGLGINTGTRYPLGLGLEGGYKFNYQGEVLVPGYYLDALGIWKLGSWESFGMSVLAGPNWLGQDWIPGIKVATELDLLAGRRSYLFFRAGTTWRFQDGFSFSWEMGIRQNTPLVSPVPEASPKLMVSPGLFSPDGDGIAEEMVFHTSVTRPDMIVSWSLDIQDPSGRPVMGRQELGSPPEILRWNGMNNGEPLVDSAAEYQVLFQVTDVLERATWDTATVQTDVLIILEGDKHRIRVPYIEFAPYSQEFSSSDIKTIQGNQNVLDRLANFFKKYPDYKFRILGHGNIVDWKNPLRAAAENLKTIKPLSLKRAETVRTALVARGIDLSRMEVEGRGGDEPLVAFGDIQNNWRNRRVEFILVKTSGAVGVPKEVP